MNFIRILLVVQEKKNILRYMPKGLCIFAKINISEHCSHSYRCLFSFAVCKMHKVVLQMFYGLHHMKLKLTNSSLYIGAKWKRRHLFWETLLLWIKHTWSICDINSMYSGKMEIVIVVKDKTFFFPCPELTQHSFELMYHNSLLM